MQNFVRILEFLMQNFLGILEFFILGILDFQQKDFYLKICFKILLGILEFLQKKDEK